MLNNLQNGGKNPYFWGVSVLKVHAEICLRGPTEGHTIYCFASCHLQVRVRQDGDVMPTLDMALFDWTDYEDLKPEMWPSAKKKGIRLPWDLLLLRVASNIPLRLGVPSYPGNGRTDLEGLGSRRDRQKA